MLDSILKFLILFVVVIYICLTVRKGYNEGFFRKVLSLITIIISILITRLFTSALVIFIKDYTNIQSTITDSLSRAFADTNIFDTINLTGLREILDTNKLNELSSEFIANNLTDFFLNAICAIFLFAITMIALKIIIYILDILDFIPVVGKINKTIGAVLGGIESILILWLVFFVIRALSNIPQIKIIEEYLKQTFFVGAIYKNNLIYNFFSALFDLKKNGV